MFNKPIHIWPSIYKEKKRKKNSVDVYVALYMGDCMVGLGFLLKKKKGTQIDY